MNGDRAAPLNGNDSPLNVCPTGGNLTWLRLGTRIVPIANRIESHRIASHRGVRSPDPSTCTHSNRNHFISLFNIRCTSTLEQAGSGRRSRRSRRSRAEQRPKAKLKANHVPDGDDSCSDVPVEAAVLSASLCSFWSNVCISSHWRRPLVDCNAP